MTVIDNILMEWTYRCPDGIVDINNPEKIKILNEILADYNINEEDISSQSPSDNMEPVTDKEIDELIEAFNKIKNEYGKYITIFSLFDPNSLGTISEVLLAKLLTKSSIPSEHVGGKQEVVDINVNNHGISLKTSSSKNIVNLGSGLINTSSDKKIAEDFLNQGIKEITISDLEKSYPDVYKKIQIRLNEIIKKIAGDKNHFFVWIEKKISKVNNKNIITDVIIHVIKLTTKELEDTFKNSTIYFTPASGWGLKYNNKIIVGADVGGKNLNIHPNFIRQYSKDKSIQINLIKEIPSIDKLDVSDKLLSALNLIYTDIFGKSKDTNE
jgi:hypothetical protein